jgi:DNA-binding NarL/FixJ family response regulator
MKVSVIMLTAYHDTEQVLHAMRTGASAYCAKDIDPDDLVDVIRQVASGYYMVEGERMTQREVGDWIQTNVEAIVGPHTLDSEEHIIPLSQRETEILQSVTNGLSNKEIANKLGISQQTVKNHMTSILRKLNVEDRTQAAVTALRRGWVRIEDE